MRVTPKTSMPGIDGAPRRRRQTRRHRGARPAQRRTRQPQIVEQEARRRRAAVEPTAGARHIALDIPNRQPCIATLPRPGCTPSIAELAPPRPASARQAYNRTRSRRRPLSSCTRSTWTPLAGGARGRADRSWKPEPPAQLQRTSAGSALPSRRKSPNDGAAFSTMACRGRGPRTARRRRRRRLHR